MVFDNRYTYFHKLYNGKFKQPDFRFDEIVWEMESQQKTFRIIKINDMMEKGLEQSKYIIIKINNKIDLDKVIAKIKGRKEFDICERLLLITKDMEVITVK